MATPSKLLVLLGLFALPLGCGEDAPTPPPAGALAISTADLPAGTVGAAYAATIVANNGSGTGYSWAVSAGALPAGLTLEADGTPSTRVLGSPTTAGSFDFTVKVTDADGGSASRALRIVVASGGVPLAIRTTSVAAGQVGAPYSAAIRARDGTAMGYAWSLASGAFPPGITLAADGTPATALSGTPTAAGSFAFTLAVEDSGAGRADRMFTIVISAAPPPVLVITTTTAPDGVVGRAYTRTLAASGGSGAGYAWALSRGDLPPGLTLAAMGTPSTTLSGTPTMTGRYDFDVRVTDDAGATTTQRLIMSIAPAPPPVRISTAMLPGGTEASPYTAAIRAVGGSGTGYMWSLSAGALPPGLTLSSTGTPDARLTGTPTAPGTFTFTVHVVDSIALEAEAVLSIEVARLILPIQIATTTVPPGARGTPYSATLATVAGTGTGISYGWAVTSGALPPGLTVVAMGTPSTQITGTPTAGGTFTATVTVFDSDNTTDAQHLVFDVFVPFSIATTTLVGGQTGTPYSAQILGEGGTGAGYVWSIVQGSLPPGLTLDAAGTPGATISGTPTDSGAFSFTVQGQDSAGATATRVLSINVVAGLTIVRAMLPDGRLSAAYSTVISAVGGTGMDYSWAVTAGALPPGLAVTPAATPATTLSGTPSTPGSFDFTLQVTDSGGATATADFTLVIVAVDRWAVFVGDARVDAINEIFVVGIPGLAPATPVVVNPIITGGAPSTSETYNQISPDGSKLAFRGDFRVDGINELFVVDLSGDTPGPALLVNPPLPSARAVIDFAWSPDSTRLIYTADQDTDNVNELYLVDVSGLAPGTPMRVNGPMPAASDISPTDFNWSPDGSRVAYLADELADEVYELFVVDVNGPVPGVPQRVNAALPTGADVDDRWAWSPDGGRIVYEADQVTLDVQEIFLVDLNGVAPSTPILLNGQMVSGGDVGTVDTDLAFSPDGAWVAYVADQDTDAVEEVYAVNVSGATPTPAVRVSGPAGSFTDNLVMKWSPVAPRLAYSSDQETSAVYEVYLVDLSGPAPTPALKIHPTFPTFGRLAAGADALQWSADGSRIAYRADSVVDNAFQIDVVDVSGAVPGPVIETVPPRATNQTIDAFEWSPDGTAIASRGENTTGAELDELFITRFTPGGVVGPYSLTGPPPISGGQVTSFVWANDRYVLVRADYTTDVVFEAYLLDIDNVVTPLPSLTPAMPTNGDVTTVIGRAR